MRRTFAAVSFCAVLLAAPSLFAQATRTWVSGVGDDANPCSRTAPCKTWAGAISKTAANGEINAIDPGGFGAVSITKGMTIDGGEQLSSILFSLTNGIIINAGTANVTIRNLDMNGGSNGLAGIRIVAAGTVVIDNVRIYNFTTNGINDERSSAGANLIVRNSQIHSPFGTGTTNGIKLQATAGTSVSRLTVHDSLISGFTNGVSLIGDGSALLANTVFAANNRAVTIDNTTDATLDSCMLMANATGIRITAAATVRLGQTTIVNSTSNAIQADAGATLTSFGTNNINGNTGNNGAGLNNINTQ
jgi:hypothetical protein